MKNLAEKLGILSEAKTLEETDSFLSSTLHQYGCDNFTYNYYPYNYQQSRECLHSICTHEAIDWSEHYVNHKYDQIDPIFIKLKNSQIPLGWYISEEIKNYQKNQKAVLEAAYDFGFQGGFGVPIHTPNGGFANLVLQETTILERIPKEPTIIQELHVIANHYQAKINQLVTANKLIQLPAQLTAREIECLRLTARHKTAKEIGRILNLSPRTVGFHLENAMHKLNATSKYQAVAIATSLGTL